MSYTTSGTSRRVLLMPLSRLIHLSLLINIISSSPQTALNIDFLFPWVKLNCCSQRKTPSLWTLLLSRRYSAWSFTPLWLYLRKQVSRGPCLLASFSFWGFFLDYPSSPTRILQTLREEINMITQPIGLGPRMVYSFYCSSGLLVQPLASFTACKMVIKETLQHN